jgi:pSer/pThr/pTyr-binding forkhead associated (FHA) protein
MKEPNIFNANLVVISGKDKGLQKYITTKKFIIGRKGGDLIIADPNVSSSHASIELINGEFHLLDLNSLNGTYVNNKKIHNYILANEDEIKLGHSVIKFFSKQIESENTLTSREHAELTRPYTDTQQTGLSKVVSEELKTIKTRKSFDQIKRVEELSKISKNKMGLEIINGQDKGKKFAFKKGSVLIGRTNADINIKDNNVSRKHALIEAFGKDQVFIRDLASTNGTYVNGKRIANARLRINDEIKVGSTLLLFITGN